MSRFNVGDKVRFNGKECIFTDPTVGGAYIANGFDLDKRELDGRDA